jgi:ribonucleoside-diphosphate reductase beta chain
MQELVRHIQRDEARHVGYGVYLLSRLVAEHGDRVWDGIEARMNALIPVALRHIEQTLEPYGESVPFGVSADDFVAVGMQQFEKRFSRIEAARTQALDDVLYGHHAPSKQDDSSAPAVTTAQLPPSGRP